MKGNVMNEHKALYPKIEIVSMGEGASIDLPLCSCVGYKPLLPPVTHDPWCGRVTRKECDFVSSCHCESFMVCKCDNDYCRVFTDIQCKYEAPMGSRLPEGCEAHVACDSDCVEVHVTEVKNGQKTVHTKVVKPSRDRS